MSIPSIYEGLGGIKSDLLIMIRENCRHQNIDPTMQMIAEVINADVTYQKTPLDLRNQRTYAVKVFPRTIFDPQYPGLILLVWCQWSS